MSEHSSSEAADADDTDELLPLTGSSASKRKAKNVAGAGVVDTKHQKKRRRRKRRKKSKHSSDDDLLARMQRPSSYSEAVFWDDPIHAEFYDKDGNPLSAGQSALLTPGDTLRKQAAEGKARDTNCCCRLLQRCCCSLVMALLLFAVCVIIFLWVRGGKKLRPNAVPSASLSAGVPLRTGASVGDFGSSVVDSKFVGSFGHAVGTADDAITVSYRDSRTLVGEEGEGGEGIRTTEKPDKDRRRRRMRNERRRLQSSNETDLDSDYLSLNTTKYPIVALVNVSLGYMSLYNGTNIDNGGVDLLDTSTSTETPFDSLEGARIAVPRDHKNGGGEVTDELAILIERLSNQTRMSVWLEGTYSENVTIDEIGELEIASEWHAVCYLRANGDARLIRTGLRQNSMFRTTQNALSEVTDSSENINDIELKQLWYIGGEKRQAGMTSRVESSTINDALCDIYAKVYEQMDSGDSAAMRQAQSFMSMDVDTLACCYVSGTEVFAPYYPANCVKPDYGLIDCTVYGYEFGEDQ